MYAGKASNRKARPGRAFLLSGGAFAWAGNAVNSLTLVREVGRVGTGSASRFRVGKIA